MAEVGAVTRMWILDDLRNRRVQELPGIGDAVPGVLDLADSAVGVDVTNVASYIANVRPPVAMTDMPAMVPPWPVAVLEYRMDVGRAGDEWSQSAAAGFANVGALLDTQLLETPADASVFVDQLSDHIRTSGATDGDLEAWEAPIFAVEGWLFLRRSGSPARTSAPIVRSEWLCHGDGRVMRTFGGLPAFVLQILDEKAEGLGSILDAWLAPVWMGIGFAHCRNVRQAETEPTYASRQERRAAERRGDRPPITFFTLQIDPVGKKGDASERNVAGAKRNLPLHIARGHFQTYTEERPMFGKHAGVFWVPAHVRGSAEAGIIAKDYAIKSPKDAA